MSIRHNIAQMIIAITSIWKSGHMYNSTTTENSIKINKLRHMC